MNREVVNVTKEQKNSSFEALCNKNVKTTGAVHTHTHTHTDSLSRKIISVIFLQPAIIKGIKYKIE